MSAMPYALDMAMGSPAEAARPADPDAGDVRRSLAGESDAFEALVSRRERDVYLLAHRMLGSRDEALDATQDTFLRVYRSLGSFRFQASFRTWVLGIAINVCRSRLTSAATRARRRTVSLEQSTGGEDEVRSLPLPDPAPDPEATTWGAELRVALRKALGQLSRDHREVLLLREVHGLDHGELAVVLGCARGTVKSRLARARAALRESLEGVWP